MIVNALLAVPAAVRNAIRTRIQDGTLTPDQQEFISESLNWTGYRTVTQNGTIYHLFDVNTSQPLRVAKFINLLPGVIVLGAWHYETGIPIGMTRNEETGELEGTPRYPINRSALIAIRPKRRTYDAQGNVTGEVTPTEPGDDLLWMGQEARIYL